MAGAVEAGQYRQYLEDNHEAFYADDPLIGLRACAYLHNHHFRTDDVLLSEPFRDTLATDRLFSADDVRGLCEFLCAHLDGGGGLDILPRVEENRFRPSKKLMDHVAKVGRSLSDGPGILIWRSEMVQKVRAEAEPARCSSLALTHTLAPGPPTREDVTEDADSAYRYGVFL